jgi:DNA adenine methylase
MDLDELFAELDHDSVRETLTRSPLNYMGAKTETLDKIINIIPQGKVFVDVFGGSGAVTIARKPSKLDVFNDRHSGVAAFFIAVKTDYQLLVDHIKNMPHSREMFLWCRDNVEKTVHDTVLRGAMWYYIVQSSFAGRCAYWGRVTKPMSPVYNKIYNNLELIGPLSTRFAKVQVENADWRQLLQDYDSTETVFYMDPPYYQSNVYAHNMSEADHREMCTRIHNLKGYVALSGYDNPIYNSFGWDEKFSLKVSQGVATAATSVGSTMEHHSHAIDRDRMRIEMLWVKHES